MKILVLNCGSSSLKYQLIDMDTEEVLAKGNYEKIGIQGSFLTHKVNGEKFKIEKDAKGHDEAISTVIDQLTDASHGVIKDINEIDAVGHRTVHGGEKFASSVVITDEVIQGIVDCSSLAPIHNPASLAGIKACQKLMPGKPMVAVFDTAFHQTMPEEAYIYNIPYEYYEKYRIRKYGFHGTSHRFVAQRTAELLGKPESEIKMVNCHLGQGASLCAIKNGKSVDTSMGLTPLAGIPMGTRSGDLDPSIVTFLMNQENLSATEMDNILNKKSGKLGISGVSNDDRDIEAAAKEGNKRAQLALDSFVYNVAGTLGKYITLLNGVDAITFTAGIGENSADTRKQICSYLEFMGVKIDDEKNSTRGEEIEISTPDSKIKVFVVPTNEELMIAKDTLNLIK